MERLHVRRADGCAAAADSYVIFFRYCVVIAVPRFSVVVFVVFVCVCVCLCVFVCVCVCFEGHLYVWSIFFQAGSMLALSRLPRDIGDRIGGECRRDVFRPVPRAGPVRPEEPVNIGATGIRGVGPHGGLRWTSASFGQLHVGLDGIVDSSLLRDESHRDAASHCGIEGPEQPRITGLHVRLSV